MAIEGVPIPSRTDQAAELAFRDNSELSLIVLCTLLKQPDHHHRLHKFTMDVHNVIEQYTQLIDRQKQTLVEAKKRQGQRPSDRKSKEHIYSKFMLAFMLRPNGQEGHLVHSSFIPPAYLPCTTPMTGLRRVAIKDLQLETHHRGTYLLLRSITPPSRMTAIMAVMEDENGDVIMLQLYQH